jgi:predicted TIM-barrel fold metal-dependent hydrolase
MERDRTVRTGLNAAPSRWVPVLTKYPRLRLCFAHAGGGAYWFGAEANTTDAEEKIQVEWSLQIIDLCRKHPSVYYDLGHMGEALERDKADALVKRLIALFAADETKHMSDKLMFGSDFPMPLETRGYETYYRTYREVFSRVGNSGGVDHQDHFFRGNALSFLNLSTFRRRAGAALTSQQLRYLDLAEQGQ